MKFSPDNFPNKQNSNRARRVQRTQFEALPGNPLILSRDEHPISRRDIDEDALKVMYRLINHGYRAFLVGGGVRDLMLGKKPKDFDVGTDAPPEKVRKIFRNSRIIGRRFKINHVYFWGNKNIEVTTFRQGFDRDEDTSDLPLSRDNVYGDPETDALRRDLTINGLFYDLSNFTVVDYVGGMEDLRNGVIRIIGDPETRIKEDPVRMIRATRHAARTGFKIEPKTYDAICNLRELIDKCPISRVFEELRRDLCGGQSLESFRLFANTGMLPLLIPFFEGKCSDYGNGLWPQLEERLRAIDKLVKAEGEPNVAVVFLAIAIGVLSHEEWEEIGFGDVVEYFLNDQEIIQFDCDRDFTSHQSLSNLDNGSSQSEPINILKKAIVDLYFIIGISKRERENMERLLKTRKLLISNFEDSHILKEVSRRGYFHNLCALLKLTEADSKLLESLDAISSSQKSKKNDGGRPPRRRRGSRALRKNNNLNMR